MPNVERIDAIAIPQEPSQSMPVIRSMPTVAADIANKGGRLRHGNSGRVQFLLIVADWHGTDLLYKIKSVIVVLETRHALQRGKSLMINLTAEVTHAAVSRN